MSPNVGNFVHDLVEMAKAMETLPQVQQELEQTKVERQSLLDRIDRINADLEQSRNYAASLEQRNHDLEVQRDDAELRFLGLEEKAHKVLAAVSDTLTLAERSYNGLKAAIDPPKPQPEPEAQPVTADVGPGPSEVPPIQSDTNAAGGNEPDWKQDQAETSTLPPTQPPASQGQGEGNPTTSLDTASAQDTSTRSTMGVKEDGATNISGASTASSSEAPKPSGPYANKLYYDHPTYVPLWDWIDGGGTEENYLWRPNTDYSQSNF